MRRALAAGLLLGVGVSVLALVGVWAFAVDAWERDPATFADAVGMFWWAIQPFTGAIVLDARWWIATGVVVVTARVVYRQRGGPGTSPDAEP